MNASAGVEFRRAGARASIQDILARKTGWRLNNRPVFDRGFTPDTYWLRMSIVNRTENSRWYLSLRNNRLDFVDFFLDPGNNGPIRKLHTGDNRPMPPGAQTSYPLFPFELAPGNSAVIYVRIRTSTHVSFPVRFYGPIEFGAELQRTNLYHIAFVLLLILYLVFQVRFNPGVQGPMEVFLALMIVCGMLYAFLYHGEGNRLLWPDSIWAKNNMAFISIAHFGWFFVLFLPGYLKLKDFNPRLLTAFRIHTLIFTAVVISFYFPLPNKLKNDLISVMMLGVYLLMLVGIIQALRRRRYWVLYLLSSWVIVFVATAALLAMLQGWLPYTFFTANAPLLSFPLDVVVIAVSLVIRQRSLSRERDELRERVSELMEQRPREPRKDQRSRRIQGVDGGKVMQDLAELFARERPYLDEGLSLTDLAKELGVRPDQLSAIINKEMKTSFADLVSEYRIREACRLMEEESDMNLLQIAFACGFGSRTSFNRVFKQRMDLPPQEYRKRL